jgi:glycosyltransferase involved in cell wall biosynthesis
LNILISARYYLPGWKGGGPVRSLSNLVSALRGRFKFWIVTSDRDHGDCTPYKGLKAGEWTSTGDCRIYYLPKGMNPIGEWISLLRQARPDLLYLNSYFSPLFTILPLALRKLRAIPQIPVLLAPRGEFAPSALSIKPFKKSAYLTLSTALGINRGLYWQATSSHELVHIGELIPMASGKYLAPAFIAPDIIEKRSMSAAFVRARKTPGELKVAFVSRICEVKNLLFAIKSMKAVCGKLTFDVYGPLEDKDYWEECCLEIRGLPSGVNVTYRGTLEPDLVVETLKAYHLLYLPTLGENFGHVCVEALMAGCPLLISDQTPWKALEKHGAGWDLPLGQPQRFTEVLQKLVDLGETEYLDLYENVRKYAGKVIGDLTRSAIDMHEKMFGTVADADSIMDAR